MNSNKSIKMPQIFINLHKKGFSVKYIYHKILHYMDSNELGHCMVGKQLKDLYVPAHRPDKEFLLLTLCLDNYWCYAFL